MLTILRQIWTIQVLHSYSCVHLDTFIVIFHTVEQYMQSMSSIALTLGRFLGEPLIRAYSRILILNSHTNVLLSLCLFIYESLFSFTVFAISPFFLHLRYIIFCIYNSKAHFHGFVIKIFPFKLRFLYQ